MAQGAPEIVDCADVDGNPARRDVGMPGDIANRFAPGFAGDRRQRRASVHAIVPDPGLSLPNPPARARDLSVPTPIITLLRTVQRDDGPSYLFISHDRRVVRALYHRVIVMQHGKIVVPRPVDQVVGNPQTDDTRRLVRAAFEIAA